METDNSAVQEALSIIDSALKEIANRDLVSSSEMSNALLDIRNAVVLSVSTGGDTSGE